MNTLNRRTFLSMGGRFAALLGLGAHAAPALGEALAQMAQGTAPVLWLQGQSCSGCSISLLNSDPISPGRLITRHLSLSFHPNLSAATGRMAVDVVNRRIDAGGYMLVVEGSIPSAMPKACVSGGEPFTQQVLRAAKNASVVIAAGTCAAFGGIPGAPNNLTGATSLVKYLENAGVKTPLVAVPGCPVHPDWLVGTLAHALKYGLPELDDMKRPKAFYSRLVHDQCPRFADYERERFASNFGEDGCLFKLGCAGPLTKADCPLRQWNSGVSFCINAGAPCVGCASPLFAAQTDYPFYLKPVHNAK
jgi:hydrogenase small subunit